MGNLWEILREGYYHGQMIEWDILVELTASWAGRREAGILVV
jgi:hypothetical protein